ncbi:MAG: haloacid dehalogenase-like hydrolase [Xanthomonadaceae bacterium]|nr:haloacid dehalogenase-like hydrolase [Xanthomonadaceae bacterium]
MKQIKDVTPLSWNPEIPLAVFKLLENLPQTPYAVFDWDHTCVYGDCQETLFHYQLTTLSYKITPAEIATHLSHHADFATLEAEFVSCAEKLDTLKHSYSLSEIQTQPTHQNFVALGMKLNDLYIDHPDLGPKFGYLWVLKWLFKFSDNEVEKLTHESIGIALRNGQLTIHSEIIWLMNLLRSHGVKLYVVTASDERVIRAIACDPALGFHFERNEIKGMRMNDENWFMTWRMGKVDAIKKEINATLGPILVLGDSDGDVDMLTHFPDLKIGIILEKFKNPKGDIGRLIENTKHHDPKFVRYFYQKRNLKTGEFII